MKIAKLRAAKARRKSAAENAASHGASGSGMLACVTPDTRETPDAPDTRATPDTRVTPDTRATPDTPDTRATPEPLDAVLRTRLRRGLLDRGRVLATLLADVMAGKKIEARLGPLGVEGKPGMRPEEKLRRALDQVEARRRLLDAGDDRFGRCDDCGIELGEPALQEMPWADRCRAHAARPGF